MAHSVFKAVFVLLLGVLLASAHAGEVALYSGHAGWMTKDTADAQSLICSDLLTAAGIPNVRFTDPLDGDVDGALAQWMTARTNNGQLDVVVLYGTCPAGIYAGSNAMPDGSIAELFIESTDGNAIMNHGDWMFFVASAGGNNETAGLVNMMDIPEISMGAANPIDQMAVTMAGAIISPTLSTFAAGGTFAAPRPLHINELAGDWYVEASLAEIPSRMRADPVIVRDGNRGRLIVVFQENGRNDPKGAVAAEIIEYLMNKAPTQLTLSGPTTTVAGTAVRYTVSLRNDDGVLAPATHAVTVNLTSESATGRFDTQWQGDYDGSVTSVTIPAGTASAKFYYRDTAVDNVTVMVDDATAALAGAGVMVTIFENLTGAEGEVVSYTGRTGWIDKPAADAQAQICVAKLNAAGISNTWFADAADEAALASWMQSATDSGTADILVLYGFFPPTIYPAGNALPDGSIAELFIESTDGNAIINHADYMFYVTDPCCNDSGGIENMMDIPGMNMWDDFRVSVTAEGAAIAPSLVEYQASVYSNKFFWTNRPMKPDLLVNDWFVEAALAENHDGTRADPIVVRDGNRGRLIPIFHAPSRNDPKGAVAAEIITWLYGYETGVPTKLDILGRGAAYVGQTLSLSVQIQDYIGSPSGAPAETTVSLVSNSATGRFDTAPDGAFDGSITSVTIAEGETSAAFYYRDTAAGTPTLTASTTGLSDGTRSVTYRTRTFAPPGEVAIYTGATWWIDKAAADAQAQICSDRLTSLGITHVWFDSTADEQDLANWVFSRTGNGKLDVLILYGAIPASLYPNPNLLPDGSFAELFIESTDGNAIIYHGDWMFYYCDGIANNGAAGLQNMMDIPGIVLGADNTPMIVTEEGRAIAPTLADFRSDRPMRLAQLAGDWLVEAALAVTADGSQAEPVIVRDGDLGRLIPVYLTNQRNDPKGAVAAEVIAWLMGTAIAPTQVGLSGSAVTVTRTPVKVAVSLADGAGIPTPSSAAVTVALASDSATGVFDTVWNGAYDGSVTSVAIPAGELSATVYYRDTAARLVTLAGTAAGLTDGAHQVNVLQGAPVSAGQVAIYTGATSWIAKVDADAQAQVCVDALNALDIANTWFASVADEDALAAWMQAATDNGEQDVLVLYGVFPSSIYPAGNAMPDDSIAERFIESSDGDAIINHADWMFYVSSALNGAAGLQNMMDIPNITMAGYDNTPMVVTPEGAAISPTLSGFLTDRPLHLDLLAGNWFVEAALAQDASGRFADPVIVRDGNAGRIIPALQAMEQNDPKGAVAAEIIAWLMAQATGVTETRFRRGDVNADGSLNIADAIFVLSYLFAQGEEPGCLDAADTNDDDSVNIADAIAVLSHLFGGAGDLPPPFAACGPDPTPGELGCESFPPCE